MPSKELSVLKLGFKSPRAQLMLKQLRVLYLCHIMQMIRFAKLIDL